MTNNKYEETATWHSKDRCDIEIIEKVEHRDPKTNEVIRISDQKSVFPNCKVSDIEAALRMKTDNLRKLQAQHADASMKLAKIGKKPFMTPEMVRFRNTLMALHNHDEYEKFEAQIKDLVPKIEEEEGFIAARQKTLASRPTDLPADPEPVIEVKTEEVKEEAAQPNEQTPQ